MTPQQTQPAAANGAPAETKNASLLDTIVGAEQERARIAARYKPVMSVDEFAEREKQIDYLIAHVLKEGVDYGWVPGTKPTVQPKQGEYQAKPTLFKAGAERVCAFFGYVPHYEEIETIEAWTPAQFGEMLFYYKYRCTLLKDGSPVGEGLASATTWESKHRYRKGERVCPDCAKSGAIIKGREEYGGGWICFGKKGGCGAKFPDGDEAIEGQSVDRVPNPDVADVVNTVQKMGQKRGYVAATLTATGLSSRFTQDLEDIPHPDAQRNTPEQQAAVADKRIAQEQNKAAAAQQPAQQQLSPQEKTELEYKRTFAASDRFKRLAMFGDFKSRMVKACGSEEVGKQVYYEILKKHGVEKADQFSTAKAAQDCGLELLREVMYRESLPPDRTPAEQQTAAADPMSQPISDDDLPRELFPQEAAYAD